MAGAVTKIAAIMVDLAVEIHDVLNDRRLFMTAIRFDRMRMA
jgi:hypothetical protein